MTENILQKIINKKIERIDLLKKSISLKSLNEKINENKSFINFKDKIQKNIDSNKFDVEVVTPSSYFIYTPFLARNIRKAAD